MPALELMFDYAPIIVQTKQKQISFFLFWTPITASVLKVFWFFFSKKNRKEQGKTLTRSPAPAGTRSGRCQCRRPTGFGRWRTLHTRWGWS